MFTKVDKAIAALIMSVLFLCNTFLGINLGIAEATLTGIIAVITPVMVYFVPNRA